MNIHCISSLFLLILVHSICEGKLELEEVSTELDENGENTLNIVQEYLSTGNSTHKHCKCKKGDCECCYKVGSNSICSMMKLICLEKNDSKNGDEFALEGTLRINNGSIFTCSLKLKEIPKLCYRSKKFDICFDLKHQGLENNKIQICGHVRARYSTTVLLNADVFCKVFEVRKAVGDDSEQNIEEERADPKFDEKKYFSLYFGQFALQ